MTLSQSLLESLMLEVEPAVGVRPLFKFGDSIEQVERLLGKSDEVYRDLDPVHTGQPREYRSYSYLPMSIEFYGERAASMQSSSTNLFLAGFPVIGARTEDIAELMQREYAVKFNREGDEELELHEFLPFEDMWLRFYVHHGRVISVYSAVLRSADRDDYAWVTP